MSFAGTVSSSTLPSLSPQGVRSLGIAAVASLVTWEVFARLVAPFWLGHPLEPTALIDMALGINGFAAHALHIVTGLVLFPIGYAFIVRPLAGRIAPAMPWWMLGVGYGIALWVFAMYVMASLIGGAPAFLGFGAVAWASLVGHVLLAIVLAAVLTAMPKSTQEETR